MSVKLPDFPAMYADMAAALTATPQELVCGNCRKRRPCPTEAARRYLAKGWPMCCGLTMSLVEAKCVARGKP